MTDAEKVEILRTALADALDDLIDWAAYADDYFQEKWDLVGDIARIRRTLESTK